MLEMLADKVQHEMAQVQGVTDLGIFRVLGQPNLNITVDREKAARYGLNAGDVNTVVQAALGGTVATTQLEAERQFNVVVRLAPKYRDDIDRIRAIRVGYTDAGRQQRLYSVERDSRPSRSIPARRISSTRRTNASFPSSSACATAIWAARWPRPAHGSPPT